MCFSFFHCGVLCHCLAVSRGTMNDPLNRGLGLGPGRMKQHPQPQRRSPGGPRNLQESRRPRHVPPTGGNGVGYHQHTAGWNQTHTTAGVGVGVGAGASSSTASSQMRRAKALMDVRQRAKRAHGSNGNGLTADDLPFRRPGQGTGPGLGLGARTRTMGPRKRPTSSSGGGSGGGNGGGGGGVHTRPPSAMQGWIRQAKAVAALEKRRCNRQSITTPFSLTHPLTSSSAHPFLI